MAVDWNADGMLEWKELAEKEQQLCFNTLGTPMWRVFEPSHYCELKRDIGYALFGVPEEKPCKKLNDDTGYGGRKLKVINNIFDIIQKCTKNNTNPETIFVSFLFAFGKIKDGCFKISFIRFQEYDTNFRQNIHRFIDRYGRVYKNWQDYLDSNKIPDCVVCYPKSGVYSSVNGAVEVEFGVSPAGRTGAKVLKYLDAGGTVLSGGATVAKLLLPVTTPVVAGVTAVSLLTGGYATGRNIQTLKDRHEHQQSIGLGSVESLNCWLGIGGFVGSVGTTAAAVCDAGPLITKSLAVGSCAVNVVAVGSNVINIIDKVRNKEKPTPLDYFQLSSTILFFTHSVISINEAMSLVNNVGDNSSVASSVVLRNLVKRIHESLPSNTGKIVEAISTLITGGLSIASMKDQLLNSDCIVVGRKLIDITISLLKGHISMCNYALEVGGLLGQLWESWKKEMTEVVDFICQEFGVKDWSELVIGGCGLTEYGHIREVAKTLIVENNSLLVQCGCTTMPSYQRQGISDNSAVVGTDDGPNSVADGKTHNYYNEIANIFAKFADRQMCRNPEDFCSYLRFVCEFVKVQFQKKKSPYEKSLEMAKRYNPDVNVEDFKKDYGISGNPNDHFLQEVFNEFQSEGKDVFTSLHLAYDKENAGTSAQEEDNRQGCLDAGGVRFYPFDSMCGLASNGMPSEQQYRELAAKYMGRPADTDSIYMSASGDTAVIQGNDGADVITVRCWEEDGKVSGIATVLRNSAE